MKNEQSDQKEDVDADSKRPPHWSEIASRVAGLDESTNEFVMKIGTMLPESAESVYGRCTFVVTEFVIFLVNRSDISIDKFKFASDL